MSFYVFVIQGSKKWEQPGVEENIIDMKQEWVGTTPSTNLFGYMTLDRSIGLDSSEEFIFSPLLMGFKRSP